MVDKLTESQRFAYLKTKLQPMHKRLFFDAIALNNAQANHVSAASLKFWGIEKIFPSPRGGEMINSLLCRETYWIHTL